MADKKYFFDIDYIIINASFEKQLSREYYFSDYEDMEKRTAILRELLGEIGENSVIGAGSVVNRAVPPNCVATGNPCRVIRCFGTDW